ncbi:MAG: hypothetical protein HXY40_18710 [Chloroflexi bacterium]|nr:hypothetical protein [Chloroflexota bacterium]
MRIKILPAVLIVLLFGVSVLHGQDDCPAIVSAALEAVDAACSVTQRNQACYGNSLVDASPRSGVTNFTFAASGDISPLTDIESLALSAMSLDDSIWGVAVMQLQANLPDTVPGQNVTMLLFGDVTISNQVAPVIELPMTASGSVNVRLRPRTDQNNIMASLTRGQSVIANGRLADGSWIRIEVEGDARGVGWVAAEFLTADGDTNSLNVVEPGEPNFGPMQAFYFASGLGDAPCAEAPDSGILVQTPQGARTVNLRANGVDIALGSTAFLQAGQGFMFVTLLEGRATVSAGGVTQAVPAGAFTRIPLDTDGLAAGTPEFPRPYELDTLQALPIDTVLPQEIVIAAPLTEAEVEEAVEEAEAVVSGTAALSGMYLRTWTEVNPCSGDLSPFVGLTDSLRVTFAGNTLTYNFISGTSTAPGIYTLYPNAAPGVSIVDTVTIVSSTEFTVFQEISRPDGVCDNTSTFVWQGP